MRYNSEHNNSGKDSMLDDNGRVSLRYRPSRDNDRKSSMLDGDGRVGLRYHPNRSGGEEVKTSADEGRVKSRFRYGWDKDGEKRQDDAPEATAAGSSGVDQYQSAAVQGEEQAQWQYGAAARRSRDGQRLYRYPGFTESQTETEDDGDLSAGPVDTPEPFGRPLLKSMPFVEGGSSYEGAGETHYTGPHGIRRGSSSKGSTTITYKGSRGQRAGSSTKVGDVTYYKDEHGKIVGSSTRAGGITYYMDECGRRVGSSVTSGGVTEYGQQLPSTAP